MSGKILNLLGEFMRAIKIFIFALLCFAFAGCKETIPQNTFLEAVKNNNMKVVEQYMKQGGNINAKDKDGVSALMLATMKGRTAIAKKLIDAKAAVK